MDYNEMSITELDTVIADMENDYYHDQLPELYDTIVSIRNDKVGHGWTQKS